MAPANAGGAAPSNDIASQGFALYDMAIGHCGFASSERRLTAVQLPETGLARTPTLMQHRFSDSTELYRLSIATGWP